MPKKGQNSTSKRTGDTLASLRTVFDILVRLQSGSQQGVSIANLAEEQGISTKQVRRYLDVLEEFGVGFEADDRGNRAKPLRITTVRRNQPPFNALFLDREELMLLYSHLAGLHHAGNPEIRDRLWDKVTHNLGVEPVSSLQLHGAIGNFDKAYKSYDDKRTIIADLLSALYGNHPCQALYRKANNQELDPYDIEPYELIEFDGGLYVFCRVISHGDVRMLAVERFQSLTVDPNKNFLRDPKVLGTIRMRKEQAFRIIWDTHLYQVKLRFNHKVSFYVAERIWHPSQKIKMHENGDLTLEFTASGRVEIERWINSWGEECEVLWFE